MHSIEHLSGQLRSLRLNSLSQAAGNLIAQAEENELSYLQFAQQLFDHELQSRNHRRIEINQRKAGFPVEKQLEEFDYRAQSSISKRQVSGRRRDCSRRPPTPPGIRFRTTAVHDKHLSR